MPEKLTECLSDMAHAPPVKIVSILKFSPTADRKTYNQTVTSWRSGDCGTDIWYDLEIAESSHEKGQGISLGLPDVEPLVWKMKAISSGEGTETGGNGSSSVSETVKAEDGWRGRGQSLRLGVYVSSCMRALALAL